MPTLPLEPDTALHSPPLSRRRLISGLSAAGALASLEAAGCAPRTGAKTTIHYMAWGNQEQLALEQQIADEFEKRNPGVHVHLFMVPGSAYPDKLQLMLASRTAPDVMRVDHYNFPALVRKGYFQPFAPFIAKEPKGFIDDFVPVALEECRYRNELYALSVLFGSVIIYYNKSLFKKAGLTDPYELSKTGKWTWDAFVQSAIALTQRDRAGRVLQFGTNMVGYPMYSSVIWNQGGEVMNSEMTRLTLDDPKAIKGISDYADLRWKFRCAPTPADSALSAFTFESGKIGMNWDWAGASPRYRKAVKDFEWDIVPTPSGPAGNWTTVKGNQLVISRESRHPEIAFEFVKFMTGPEVELRLDGRERRCVPTRVSVQRDPRYLAADRAPFQTDVFLESIRRGRTLPINWRYQEWLTEFNNAMEGLFTVGGETAETACLRATANVNALLASPEGF